MNTMLKALLNRAGVQVEEYIVNNGTTIQRFNSRVLATRAFRTSRTPVGATAELIDVTNGASTILESRTVS